MMILPEDGLPNTGTACLVLLVSRQEGGGLGEAERMSQSKRRRDQGNWHQESKARAAGHLLALKASKHTPNCYSNSEVPECTVGPTM